MVRFLIGLTVVLICGLLPLDNPAWGQFGSTNQESNNTQAGSSSSLSNSQGYGLNSRFGGSNFDTFMSGSSALGTTTAGAQAGTSGFGQSGTGGNRNTAGTAGGFGNFGLGGLGGFGGLRGFGGRGGMGGNVPGQTQQSTQNQKVIRTRLKLGFKQPTPAGPAISASYEKIIRRVLERDDYADGTVNLIMDGETAVLQGTVGSPHARDVAERLALLEPGIAEVRNELTLRADEPKPATSPKPSAPGQPQ